MKRAFSFGDKTIDAAVRRVNEVRCIALIGAGTMGQGIALDLLSKTDARLILLDVSDAALERARETLMRWRDGQVRDRRIREEDARVLEARVSFTRDDVALRDADLIWEVASERSEIKASIFQRIERTIDVERIAAVFSNTSSHTTSELAELFTSEAFREKLLTVHGYYPFERNRLIDVMKGKYASNETFAFGTVFADQLLEKSVIALPVDHHGYITDPIFQAMAAIISWDVRNDADIVQLGGLWELLTANPFQVLDLTGHMPYTESSRHFGQSLPAHDRLRGLYQRDGRSYPDWIAALEKKGTTGFASSARTGFFAWGDGPSPGPPRAVLDPACGEYVPIREISRRDFWSYYEAVEIDRRAGKVRSADALVHVARAADAGGRAFRRYALPICLYALDLIDDGVATPGQINLSTRAGLRYKVGLIELIDALIAQLTVDGLIELVRRARDENADDPHIPDILDIDGVAGPRQGRPSLLLKLKDLRIERLLGYGRFYRTPVAEVDVAATLGATPRAEGRPARGHPVYRGFYPELKFVEPSTRDRVAAIVFNNPLRGNVFNRALIDQLAHAWSRVLALHRAGKCGAVLFTAAGSGMRMLGADAREFNRGWFERRRGYVPLPADEAAASSRNAVQLFRMIQRSPVATIGVFGEKWGGGAEFTYFLDQRFDVRAAGFVFDSLERRSDWRGKNTYNQPELDYAILPGFGAAGELKRLGLGDSAIFELFDQGLTADRAHQLGLSNGVFDDELEALRRGFERARTMAKDAPYSRALFKKELTRHTVGTACAACGSVSTDQAVAAADAELASETAETFDPAKNPFIRSGLLTLLDRGGKPPPMDYACGETALPGWQYPAENGMADSPS
ncbi:MAG: 3-hydroxyacyl-CoA dehydrogenase NAD-binding domain-containing protein [Phycisphaerae bacterium]|nr:3-hydroxyacyl-CoA dehydrogenase NAD-binding domain-containing protein [Phycisphaerae bacterium]